LRHKKLTAAQTVWVCPKIEKKPYQEKIMKPDNREIVRSCHEKLNQGDLAAALEMIAEEVTNHGIKVGREGYKMVLEDIYATFPDWTFEIDEIVAEEETVVVRTRVRGTHLGRGEFPVNGGMMVGVEPTGKSFEVQHIHWYKLRDGKIVEHYANRHDIGMMQQLGILPETV
jgi:predicted ester cyclase